MSYSLHIERDDKPISLGEWREAVAKVNGARIDDAPVVKVNPASGEKISFPGSEGDVAVDLGGEWVKVLFFRRGRASFKGTEEVLSPDSPVHQTAAALARSLDAKIRGDEGEEYEW